MFVRLPVARVDVVVRLPSGAEDLLLVESGALDMRVAVALLSRLTDRADDAPIDWATVSVTDIDTLLLRLRQNVLGDVVRAEVSCADPGCQARVDIAFSINDYLEHHRPTTTAVAVIEGGWYRIADRDVTFRLPQAADQIAIALETEPEVALLRRCVRSEGAALASQEVVESAMEALAPSLCSELEGVCPSCGATVEVTFDPLQFTLRELRDQAAFIYEEVCSIAERYHWSETDILAMPTRRRARYAERAQQEAKTF